MLQKIIDDYWTSLDTVQKGIGQGTIYGIAQGIEQGIQLGKEEGRIEGHLEALRPVLVRLMETRFPNIAIVARQQAARIKDPEMLKMIVDGLIMAKTESEAMQLLMTAMHRNNTAS